MPPLPDEIWELIDHAEETIKASDEAAVFSSIKDEELDDAIDAQEEAKEVAFDSMEEAVAAAALVIDAIKDHFGV